MSLTVSIIGALLLVATNGFFVATEFAIARIRVTQVDELETEGRVGSRSLRDAVEHLDAYLAACQLGITLASIALGIVGEPAFSQLIEPLTGDLSEAMSHAISFAFSFAIVTLLHVVFGELAPKSLAIARNTSTALKVAPVMRGFYLATKPVVDVFNWLGNLVLKPFGVPPASEAGHAPHSERELRELMRQSQAQGLIEQSDVDFTEGVFTFGDRDVADIMVPRPEIQALPADLPGADVLATVIDSSYTRYPVYRDSLDTIHGILHVRDLFPVLHADGVDGIRLDELARPAYFVPETKKLAALLAEVRRTNQHLAIVVDEYGATQGIVTLEDLLEEIVGEIEDEHDAPDDSIEELDVGRLHADGTYPIDDFNDRYGLELPNEDFHTLAGLVFGELGQAPVPGDTVQVNGATFKVLETVGPRIERVEVELPQPEPEQIRPVADDPAAH